MLNNKKICLLLLIAISFIECFAHAQQSTINQASNLYPEDIKRILDRNKIIIGVIKKDVKPFVYFDPDSNDNLSGIDINIGRSIANALGVEVKFERVADTFNDVIDLVVRGEVDIALSKLSVTEERNKRVLFSKPYAIFNHGLLLDRTKWMEIKKTGYSVTDALQIEKHNKKDSIKPIKLSILSDSSYVFFANNILKATNIDSSINNWDDMIDALKETNDAKNNSEKKIDPQKEIQAIYRDIFEIKKILIESYDLIINFATLSFENLDDKIAIAVNFRDKHLKYWLDNHLANYLAKDMFIKKTITKKKIHCQKIVYSMVNKRNFEEVFKEFCTDNQLEYYDAETVIQILQDLNNKQKVNK